MLCIRQCGYCDSNTSQVSLEVHFSYIIIPYVVKYLKFNTMMTMRSSCCSLPTTRDCHYNTAPRQPKLMAQRAVEPWRGSCQQIPQPPTADTTTDVIRPLLLQPQPVQPPVLIMLRAVPSTLCNACVSDRFYAGPVQSNASLESVPYICQPPIPRWFAKHKPRLNLRWHLHPRIPLHLHFSDTVRMVLAITHTPPYPTFAPTSNDPSIATFE